MVENLICGSEGAQFKAHHWQIERPVPEKTMVDANCKRCPATRTYPKDPVVDGHTYNNEFGKIASRDLERPAKNWGSTFEL